MLHKNTADRHLKLVLDSGPGHTKTAELDLVCFSHLRWDFVYQRPQHLLSRAARTQTRVVHRGADYDAVRTRISRRGADASGVTIVIPHVPVSQAPCTCRRC